MFLTSDYQFCNFDVTFEKYADSVFTLKRISIDKLLYVITNFPRFENVDNFDLCIFYISDIGTIIL